VVTQLTVPKYMRALAVYVNELRQAPGSIDPLTFVRDFPSWLRSQHRSALGSGDPWITFGARRALEKLVTRESRVFEYGAGGSTLFFARRAGLVVSVEHDPEWLQRVRAAVEGHGNVEVILAQPEPIPSDALRVDVRRYTSSDPRHKDQWFRNYARTIDRFPDGFFDLIVVDGRARVGCLIHGLPKVRRGGWMLLDDSDRDIYAEARLAVASWPPYRYVGPKPYVPQFCETTIWQRPAE
jgi:hypothetical protein